ncbi:hypothetical protein M2419_002392 [Sphingobacterium sp. BIGb0116]|nr:hypothetical protein [Sphingobacterium sp. BIGb0116]
MNDVRKWNRVSPVSDDIYFVNLTDDGYEFFEDFCQTFNIETNGSSADDFFSQSHLLIYLNFGERTLVRRKSLK